MGHSIEREVKLNAGPGFVLPDLTGIVPGVVGHPLADLKLQATYYDTDDLRLMRWGITLRYRIEAGAGTWTAKLPTDVEESALVRLEISCVGEPDALPDGIRHLL